MTEIEKKINPKEIIEELLKYLKISKNALGKSIGDKNGMRFQYIINGRNKKVSEKLANDIVKVYSEISYNWLTSGKGDMIARESIIKHLSIENIVDYLLEIPQKKLNKNKSWTSFLKKYYKTEYLKTLTEEIEELESKIKKENSTKSVK